MMCAIDLELISVGWLGEYEVVLLDDAGFYLLVTFVVGDEICFCDSVLNIC